MTKEELISRGYIYINTSSGYVSLFPNIIAELSAKELEDVLASIKEFAKPENYELVVSNVCKTNPELDALIVTNVIKGGIEVLEDIKNVEDIKRFNGSPCFSVERTIKEGKTYEKIYATCRYLYGNELQEKSMRAQKNKERLEMSMDTLAQKGFDKEETKKIAMTFNKLTSVDNIELMVADKDISEKKVSIYTYDRHGLTHIKAFSNDKLTRITEIDGDRISETRYAGGRAVTCEIKYRSLSKLPVTSSTEFRYNGDLLEKKKTTDYIAQGEGKKPFCYTTIKYTEGNIDSAKINELNKGKKLYKFTSGGFVFNSNDKDYTFEKGFCVFGENDKSIDKVRALTELEGALMQLKTHIPEYVLDYDKILKKIYSEKIKYVLETVNSDSVIIYLADKGNLTVYDKDTKEKQAFFPADIARKYIPLTKSNPNIIFEQRIREGNDPEAIRMLYDFGKDRGDQGVFNFGKVVKSLSKNTFTPPDILDDITTKIFEEKYDVSNLRYIAANPHTSTETLQKIINKGASPLVMATIEENMNRPSRLKKKYDEQDKKRAENKIFSDN